MTSKFASINANHLAKLGFNFQTLLVDDCNLIPEIEIFSAMRSQSNPSNITRIGLFGHSNGGRPHCNDEFLSASGASVSLIDRLLAAGFTSTTVLSASAQNASPWNKWIDGGVISESPLFDSNVKFVAVDPILGSGEEIQSRGYIQNLDEAEFAVALFQLLRLSNVPAKDIAILSAYKGQVDLINEIIDTRCNWTGYYSNPAYIGTIDQCQGLRFQCNH
jgi:hypothetical protein